MDKALRLAEFGPQVDEFVASMNQAAEQAAPLAEPVKTQDQLAAAFKPEVEKAMSQVGVTAQYKQLVVQESAFDVDNYVVGKTLDGLFYTLAQEEQKIRTNPTARVTGLLKEVFGK